MDKRKRGTAYEAIAAQYLEKYGVKILEKNYRTARGEVDIIALDKDILVFIEVKYRKNAEFGQPWEAVFEAKQRRICRAAEQYCYTRHTDRQVRYDVISICGEEIEWFKDAFPHCR